VLFLVLKYRGDFLYLFLLGLSGVLKVAKVAATSYSVSPGDKLVCFGGIFVSLGSVVFSGLDFSCFSPSSFSSCSPPTFSSSSSIAISSYVSLSSSFDPTTSSSFVLAPSSSSSILPSFPPTLEVEVSPSVRDYFSNEEFSIHVYEFGPEDGDSEIAQDIHHYQFNEAMVAQLLVFSLSHFFDSCP